MFSQLIMAWNSITIDVCVPLQNLKVDHRGLDDV